MLLKDIIIELVHVFFYFPIAEVTMAEDVRSMKFSVV